MAKKAPRRTAERILEVTLELFNRFGEPNVSTTLISAELNISPGNLYYHFGNKDEIVNEIFGLGMNWIGGSRVCWIHTHDIQHHIHTNDVHRDPDIDSIFVYRLNPRMPLLKIHLFQHIYYFVILGGFALQHAILTVKDLITVMNALNSLILRAIHIFIKFSGNPLHSDV